MGFDVSVVMPAYNAEKTIRLAIRTTLNALSRKDELIVIDDGSSDATQSIVSSFSDIRLRLLINQKNLGIAESLNRGIDAARNAVIARADSDDLVPFWRFTLQKRLLQKEKVDFLFGSQMLLRGKVPLLPFHTWISRRSGERFNRAMSLACIVAHPTLMAKKTAIEELGGYPNVVAEDYALWLSALSNGYSFLRHWFPQNFYRLSSYSVSKKDASREGYLNHLRDKRINLFIESGSQRDVDRLISMKRFRRELLLLDPFLYLETGVRVDPLETLSDGHGQI